MEKILKSKLYRTQNSYASWLMTTMNNIIEKPVKEIGLPVFSFRRTQEAEFQNINILASFNGNLGTTMESQKGIPLDYGSELRDITRIANLFSHHEYQDIIA